MTGLEKETTHVLLIGAGNYPNWPKMNIPNVAINVDELSALLSNPDYCGIAKEQIKTVKDEDLENTSAVIYDFFDSIHTSKATVIIYYSGHGLQSTRAMDDLFLATKNIRENRFESSCIRISELRRLFSDCPAGRKILLLDCCYAGKITKGFLSDDTSDSIAKLSEFEGTYIMAASSEYERARFDPDNPNSPTKFTGKFLEVVKNGMENEDEYCTLNSIYNQIRTAFLSQNDAPKPIQVGQNTVANLPLFKNKKFIERKPADEREWEKVCKKNTKWAYIDFGTQFPLSIHVTEATRRAYEIEEEEYWNLACNRDTLSSYYNYLNKYPDGRHTVDANGRISKIRDIEQKEQLERQQRQEESGWMETRRKNTIAAYIEFLQSYPNGKFYTEAEKRIQALEEEERSKTEKQRFLNERLQRQKEEELELKEENLWLKVQKKNTVAYYQDYLVHYPHGRYSMQARVKIDELEESKGPPIPLSKPKEVDPMEQVEESLMQPPSVTAEPLSSYSSTPELRRFAKLRTASIVLASVSIVLYSIVLALYYEDYWWTTTPADINRALIIYILVLICCLGAIFYYVYLTRRAHSLDPSVRKRSPVMGIFMSGISLVPIFFTTDRNQEYYDRLSKVQIYEKQAESLFKEGRYDESRKLASSHSYLLHQSKLTYYAFRAGIMDAIQKNDMEGLHELTNDFFYKISNYTDDIQSSGWYFRGKGYFALREYKDASWAFGQVSSGAYNDSAIYYKTISDDYIKHPHVFDIETDLAVGGLNFYESGGQRIENANRIYTHKFLKRSTRYINWELNFKHPTPEKPVSFKIEYRYYKPDGTLWTTQDVQTTLTDGWTTSETEGWGWKIPGNWVAGVYAVEFYISGKMITKGQFEVVALTDYLKVSGVRFFKSAESMPQNNDRQYASKFDRITSSLIGFELHLIYPTINHKTNFEVLTRIYDSNGMLYKSDASERHIDSSWSESYSAKNYNFLSAPKGTYTAKFFIESQLVATGSFELY